MNTQDKISLYYKEGSSDKEYHVSIEPQGSGFVVNFSYGRRGSTLNTGSKTSSPIEYGAAKGIYDKLVREKKAKGYTEGQAGTPYQHTDKESQVSGILPQLLNSIEEDEVPGFLQDANWCMQEKKDGKRLLLKKYGGEVTGINRKGLVVGIPVTIVTSAREIPNGFILDGECVGEVYYVFDLLQVGNDSLQSTQYRQRLNKLTELLEHSNHPGIELVETAFDQKEKVQFLETFKQDKVEGVVFKRLESLYTTGRPASGGPQLKYKFYSTASARVGRVNAQRSIKIQFLDGAEWKHGGM